LFLPFVLNLIRFRLSHIKYMSPFVLIQVEWGRSPTNLMYLLPHEHGQYLFRFHN
jgi:hypothetical protein